MPVLSAAYVVTLAVTVAASVGLCLAARRSPGPWIVVANRALAAILVAVSGWWIWTTGTAGRWSVATSLPLALCDLATLVAAGGLLSLQPTLVELTYFWGLAGSLQSLLTPDVRVGFPSAEFLQYVLAHAGIVTAALFLVVGQRLYPRRGAVPRVLLITAVYTAFVGLADALSGGDYMYLSQRPRSWTLLSVLGPWPWYVLSAAGVAILLVLALDAPFRHVRSSRRRPPVLVR